MEAVGPVTEEADLVVEPFEPTVGETVLDGGEDAILVLADRPAQLDERGEAAGCGPGEPGAEPGLRLGERFAVEVAERLLEQVRAVKRAVDAPEYRELLDLVGIEVLGCLEQDPAGLLDRARLVLAFE